MSSRDRVVKIITGVYEDRIPIRSIVKTLHNNSFIGAIENI